MWSEHISVEAQAHRFQLLDAFIEEPFRFNKEIIETSEEVFSYKGFRYQVLVKSVRTVGTGETGSNSGAGNIVLVAIVGHTFTKASLAIDKYFRTKSCFNPTGVIGASVGNGEVYYQFYSPMSDWPESKGNRMEARGYWEPKLSINSFLRSKLQIEKHWLEEKRVEKVAIEVKAMVEQTEVSVPNLKLLLGRYVEYRFGELLASPSRRSNINLVFRSRVSPLLYRRLYSRQLNYSRNCQLMIMISRRRG